MECNNEYSKHKSVFNRPKGVALVIAKNSGAVSHAAREGTINHENKPPITQ